MVFLGFHDLVPSVGIRFAEVASRTPQTLRKSCEPAIEALRVKGSRNLLLVVDETCWSAGWEVIIGLRPDPNIAYIGGYLGPLGSGRP